MASEFDLLLRDLRLVQARSGPTGEMSKALSTPSPSRLSVFRAPVPDTSEMLAEAKSLEIMAKSLNARNAADRRNEAPAKFFKALSETRRDVERRIAAGTIGADDAIVAETVLNRLADRAAEIIAKDARQ